MNFRRVAFPAIFFLLPGFVLVATTVWFCVSEVQRRERGEPRRLTYAYRAEVRRIVEDPDLAEAVGKRPPGPSVGRIDGAPWGYVVSNGVAKVWLQTTTSGGRREWRVLAVPLQKGMSWRLIYYPAGAAVCVIVMAFSSLCCLFFLWMVKAKDDFLAATAHDLTTPLVGLRLTVGRNDEEAKILVERMVRLVTNIKDFLKMGGTRPKPKKEVFDLQAAYREAYSLFAADYRDEFDGEDVPIRTDGDLRVVADETLAIQILWNLIGNDLKYAAPYGKVRAEIAREGRFVRFALTDEGPGLTPRERKRVFDRYYRARTSLETGKGGFGIGLCTAKEFAEAMGGRLTVGPNGSKGSVFLLLLPAFVDVAQSGEVAEFQSARETESSI